MTAKRFLAGSLGLNICCAFAIAVPILFRTQHYYFLSVAMGVIYLAVLYIGWRRLLAKNRQYDGATRELPADRESVRKAILIAAIDVPLGITLGSVIALLAREIAANQTAVAWAGLGAVAVIVWLGETMFGERARISDQLP
jgi:hypothetical protein